ncbi:hypothetical protein CPB97_010581 [Podila verticillata]|nr:hypothetical protein CPB97_010581 [Podila verticillata]
MDPNDSVSRLDRLADLATSPTTRAPPPSSSSSSSHHHPHPQHQQRHYSYSHPSQSMEDSRGHPHHSQGGHPHPSHGGHHYPPGDHNPYPPPHHHYPQHHSQHPSYSKEGRHGYSHHSFDQSPITPTTTRKFNRMAIHEVLDGHEGGNGGHSPPLYKRKGSPEESSFSDPPSSYPSRPRPRGDLRTSDQHRAHSPQYRHESPMPGSNSEDEDDDIRNYKKRRMVPGHPNQKGPHRHSPPPSGGTEVMDQVRSTLKLKQQQKAIIESRQAHGQGGLGQSQSQAQGNQTSPSQQGAPTSSNGNQPVTEKNPSGISVFHGSASFAALSRRPIPSPKNPKNAKSLTIFAPSYSESSLSIHSAPLQPSQSHQVMSMNPRTSHPLRGHPHPYSQSSNQPLLSPRGVGHAKKSSRVAPRPSESSSGTLPAPILSSHTGPLPSPSFYPHPSTPFHPNNPKQMFMETVSTLFDSVDSTRSLKYTLEEQIRKSAQLLQTLQASGSMIESLVRGQFKELEKGVIERFEGEIEHLTTRVRLLEEHQGLTPPPKKKASPVSSSSMTGVTSTNTSSETTNGLSSTVASSSNGTLPSPPLTKTQDGTSAMEVEDEDLPESGSAIRGLQDRVSSLEKKV